LPPKWITDTYGLALMMIREGCADPRRVAAEALEKGGHGETAPAHASGRSAAEERCVEPVVGRVWDAKRALDVYRRVFPDDPIFPGDGDPREREIVEEMNAVKMAATPEEGAKAIEWWGWDEDWTAVQAARRIRRFGPANKILTNIEDNAADGKDRYAK
jgi:hypothetical protein